MPTATRRIPPLPNDLVEPLIFISMQQGDVLNHHQPLRQALQNHYTLPAWVPHRIIAEALGYGQEGIQNALKSLDGKPYLWATEFENVHELWHYDEPSLQIDGRSYHNSEHYFHSQKPVPFDRELWDGGLRNVVMERGLRAKLAMDPFVHELLLVTGNHPLLSIKLDSYWGFHPEDGGKNYLGCLWMKIRQQLLLNNRQT